MRSFSLATVALALSLATASPMNKAQADSRNRCSPARVKTSVYTCAAYTEMTPVECFGTMCAKLDLTYIRNQNQNQNQNNQTVKRQDPLLCSDQNLFDCTIRDWKDAGECFREFCL